MTEKSPRIEAGAEEGKVEQQKLTSPPENFQLNSSLDWALSYAKRGWYVLPLHSMHDGRCSCGKENCASPAKHGEKDASNDPAQINAWWEEWPDANVGIATGPSELIVFDVDGEEGLAVYKKVARDRSKTLLAKTGRPGGHHLYYAGTGIPSSQMKGEHLDVRGSTRYVVAPGSVHANGTAYTFLNPDCPVAPVPTWVGPWVASRSARKTASPQSDVFGLPRRRAHVSPRHHKLTVEERDQLFREFQQWERSTH